MYLYYLFSGLAILIGFQALRNGLRFASYVRRECAQPLPDFTPFTSIIAPCRGVDLGLEQNLRALCVQNYPAYEIVFVTDEPSDPSVPVINHLKAAFAAKLPIEVMFAGKAHDSGQKVHNLRAAVTRIADRSEVLVFVDADARPSAGWLRSLVAPLQDQSLGATTGYRWFLSSKGGLMSQLLSVWNASIASALGERGDKNFCWGGATAIRRAVFDQLHIRERWRGTVSDDFTVMRVLREAKRSIKFVPACLTASLEECDWNQLLEFTSRQLQITRVYAPHFWYAALLGGLLFNSIFFGGLALLALRLVLGLPIAMLLLILGTILFLGTAKAYVRWTAVAIPLADYIPELRKSFLAHLLLWPLGALLFLYNAIVAARTRRIVWRGIGYELKSPTEAVIISRD
jgi:cellulose synthase/poly-beta-1,6-N-acetylglucosamine synthase-like glycosyltransferase